MSLQINPALPQIMWLDLNSAFATTEQQAHPSLRHRPVGVTNRISPNCCIITASYEAKAQGVHTGMRRTEALRRCPGLILVESHPAKYSTVYRRLFRIMHSYSPDCDMKSIDEGYIDLRLTSYDTPAKLIRLGQELKDRVKREIGEYLTINVGLGSNRFLAKLAAGLHKPDGLDMITADNLVQVYSQLQLEDLTGIAERLGHRLRRAGINTPVQFLGANEVTLRRQVFHGITGTYWYQRLRGYEVDDQPTKLSMIGRQWVVDHGGNDEDYLSSCLHCLAENVGLKLRYRQIKARGVCVWLRLQAGGHYQRKVLSSSPFDSDQAIWQPAEPLFRARPAGRICQLGIYVYHFQSTSQDQLSLLSQTTRSTSLVKAIDQINQTYGLATIHSAHSSLGIKYVRQKVPFGSTKYFDLLID